MDNLKLKQPPTYEIPKDWNIVKLSEIFTLEYGKGLPASERIKGNYPVFGSNGIVGYHEKFLVEGPGIIVGRKGTIGAVKWVESDFWPIDTTYFVKTKNESVFLKWLFFKLKQSNLPRLSQSDVVPGLKRELVYNITIPLPPLPEQRRIAEVLGTVDSAIQKVGGAIEGTKRLKKGLMQRLLTRGIGHERFKFSKELNTEIPEEWNVVKFEDVTGHVGSGLTPRGGALTYLNHGIPLIRSQNVLMNKLDLSDVAYISKETHKYMARSVVFSGDLLLNITGASIGRVAIIPKSVSEANVNQHVCCIRFSEVIIPIFASYYLSSTNGQNQIMSFQAGATRQGLNYKQVKSILIPLPPLPEQRRIAEILSAVDRKLELERRRKEKLERVKKGLMNELLTGRKRVKV